MFLICINLLLVELAICRAEYIFTHLNKIEKNSHFEITVPYKFEKIFQSHFESTNLILADTSLYNNSPENLEEAYFILVYKDILRSRIVTLVKEDTFYFPLSELFRLLEINYNLSIDKKLFSGFFIEEDSIYSFNFAKLVYEDRIKSFPIKKNDFVLTPLEIYVKPDLLKKSFGFLFDFNFSELTIKLNTDKYLPVYNRIKREYSYSYIYKEIVTPDYIFSAKRSLFHGFLFDYFVSSNFTKGLPPFYNYNVGFGGIILGGNTEIGLNGSINQKYNSINDYIYKWSYILNKKNITQISLGTFEYNGLQQSSIEGVSITNEPIEPRKNFYNYVITEQCGPNWTVELYVNNKLIDVTKADANGFYHFKIPLNYGTSFIHLKYYSPTGKYLSTKKIFQIPIKFIPPGEFNYIFNLGRVIFNNNLIAQLGGTYGFKDWLTSSVGVEFLKNNDQKFFSFYTDLNARLSSSYLFNLLLAPQVYYKFSFNALFYSQTTVNILATKYFKNYFYNPFNLTEDLQLDFFSPIDFKNFSFNIGTNVKFQNSNEIKNKHFAFNLGTRTEYVNPTISYKLFYSKNTKYLVNQSYLTYGLILPLRMLDKLSKHLKANLLGAQFNYDITRNKLVQYNIIYSVDFLNESRLEVIYNNIANSGSYLQCGLVVNLPFVKTWSNITSTSVFTNFYGAFAYDYELSKYSFYNRTQVGKSAIICRLFIDKNGNNKFDDDEILISDGDIFLDTPCAVEREKDGIIKIRELNPYTTYIIKVKENIRNPFLVPVYKTIAFQTEPNSSKIIDIPFYEAVEVYGNVTLLLNDNTKRLLNGIRIILENLNNNSKLIATTFSDGSFYLLGVKPAKYKIYIDPEQLKSLKSYSIPENIIYDFDSYESTNKDINFEIRISK